MTYYEVLGVDPTASAAEISARYRIRSRLRHPDRHSGESPEVIAEANRQMGALNEAYCCLTNPAKRAAYDQVLVTTSASATPPGGAGIPFSPSGWSHRGRYERIPHHRAEAGDAVVGDRTLRLGAIAGLLATLAGVIEQVNLVLSGTVGEGVVILALGTVLLAGLSVVMLVNLAARRGRGAEVRAGVVVALSALFSGLHHRTPSLPGDDRFVAGVKG